MENKRYYWLKLKEDFFNDKKIKKLRMIAGGDTYTIIYLKLLLLSLKNEGNLYFENVEDNFIEELALEINEQVEDVKVCVMYLIKTNLIQEINENEYCLPETKLSIGSETASTIRSRKCRENKKLLQSNTLATKCNIDIDIDKEKDIDIDIDKEKYNTLYNLVETNFKRTLNAIEYEYISKWEDNELTRYVIKETIAKCIYNVKYIDTTLNNYKNKGITTIQQAQEQERFYQKKKDEYNQKKYLTANERASLVLDEFVRRGELEDLEEEKRRVR